MQGNNELLLNTATMIEAAQLWLDSRMKQPVPTVTSVSVSQDGTFKVKLSGDADRPAKPTPAA
jgi:hypothetical protein